MMSLQKSMILATFQKIDSRIRELSSGTGPLEAQCNSYEKRIEGIRADLKKLETSIHKRE
jgi:peptidoglycan hydrolase CwlO-like protein